VIVLRVLDPSERSFPFTGPAMFRDVESGRALYVDPSSGRDAYLRRFEAHANDIGRCCSDLGIELMPSDTDRPLELVLFDLLKARMRRSRVPGRRSPAAGGRR
jgi:hypothetical protein